MLERDKEETLNLLGWKLLIRKPPGCKTYKPQHSNLSFSLFVNKPWAWLPVLLNQNKSEQNEAVAPKLYGWTGRNGRTQCWDHSHQETKQLERHINWAYTVLTLVSDRFFTYMTKGRYLPAEKEHKEHSKQGECKAMEMRKGWECSDLWGLQVNMNIKGNKAWLLEPLLSAFCIQLNKEMLNKYSLLFW